MLPLPDLEVVRPTTLGGALTALADAPGESRVLAGGTDVLPALKLGLSSARRLVSLRAIASLREIRLLDGGALEIGAGASLASVAGSTLVREHAPALAAAASLVGSPQVRAAGTLGGNVCLSTRCDYFDQSAFWRGALGHCARTCGETCHVVEGGSRCVAALSADTPGPLVALGASVRVASPSGTRAVLVGRMFGSDGAAHVRLAPEEIVTHVVVPPARGARSSYAKLRARGAIDFPLLGVAVALAVRDRVIERVEIVLTGLGPKPRSISGLDELGGAELDGARAREVGERAYAQAHPLPNVGADATWRRDMVPVLVRRELARLAPWLEAEARRGAPPDRAP